MHGLATIISLNDRATQRCLLCRQFAINLRGGKVLHEVEWYGPDTDSKFGKLCTDCLAEEAEVANRHGVSVREVKANPGQ